MTVSPEKKLIRRRLVYVFLAAVILIGGTIFGWNYLANQIKNRVDQQVEKLASQGKTLECSNQRVEGFPFRVGLFCDDITYDDKTGKTYFKAGQLRSAAQFYQPGFVVGELDSPAVLNTPNMIDLKLDWKLARSSSRIKVDGLHRVSLSIDDLEVTGASGLLEDKLLTAFDMLELHFRPAGEDTGSPDIEAAIKGTGVRFINSSSEQMPPLDIEIDGVVPRLNKVLRSGKDFNRWIRIHGLPIQIHKFELSMKNGARLTAKGPLKITRKGLLEGVLDVEVDGFQKLVENFAVQNPQLSETAKSMKAASLLFANGNEDGIVRLKLQISSGVVTMGFFPLGTIPKFF